MLISCSSETIIWKSSNLTTNSIAPQLPQNLNFFPLVTDKNSTMAFRRVSHLQHGDARVSGTLASIDATGCQLSEAYNYVASEDSIRQHMPTYRPRYM